MKIFHHPDQALHAPTHEFHNGALAPHAEVAGRTANILAVLGPTQQPDDAGIDPIHAVHSPAYCAMLRDVPRLWREAGRAGDAIPYAFPVVGRRPLSLTRVDALLGAHAMDSVTPVTPDTWAATYGSAQAALAATRAVLAGERAAFALCRPPGHHAGPDYCGGYCYLNHAAIAAQSARDAGVARVAILDIDYHHGNGTQDIFWRRGDVFYASLHADPATDFPFYWGHADEHGEGDGFGTTRNLPLPRGTDGAAFRAAQDRALKAIADFDPGLLIVSFGADTWEGDPISAFRIATGDYRGIASDIAAFGWPTAIIMEGGYAVDALGTNVAALLSGF